jgi:hypothetical protein
VNLTLAMSEKTTESKRKLELQGIMMPTRPGYVRPSLPADITSLDDADLMSLFQKSTAWLEWIGAQLAVAEVDEKYAESTLDQAKAYNAIANKSEKTVTAAKAKLYENQDFLDAQDAYQASYAFRKLNATMYAAEERNNSYYSRELTRRVGRNDKDNRMAKWNA